MGAGQALCPPGADSLPTAQSEAAEAAVELVPVITGRTDEPVLAPQPPGPTPADLIPAKRLDVYEPEATISWEDAANWYGKTVTVEGRVVRTYNSGKAVFLNFAQDWKGKFTAVIFQRSFADYRSPPEELFLDRQVRITGKVKKYKGAPEIVIDMPAQIEIAE